MQFKIDPEFHVYNSAGFQIFSDDLESMFRTIISKSTKEELKS